VEPVFCGDVLSGDAMAELESYDITQYWNEIRQCLTEISEHPRAREDEAYAYFLMNVTENLIQLYDQLVQMDRMLTDIAEAVKSARDSLYEESDTGKDGAS